jgi:hypothetical protein
MHRGDVERAKAHTARGAADDDRAAAYADIAVGYNVRLPALENAVSEIKGLAMSAVSYAQRCDGKIDLILGMMKPAIPVSSPAASPSIPPPRIESPPPRVYVREKLDTGRWDKMSKEDAEFYTSQRASEIAEQIVAEKFAEFDRREREKDHALDLEKASAAGEARAAKKMVKRLRTILKVGGPILTALATAAGFIIHHLWHP